MKAECASGTFIYNGKTHSCPLSVAMDLTGGKWKAIVLYHLQDGAKRFGELHTHVGGATEAVLSRTLKQLENDGLVSRTVSGSKPPLKCEYALTDFGRTFLPALSTLTAWGNLVLETKGKAA